MNVTIEPSSPTDVTGIKKVLAREPGPVTRPPLVSPKTIVIFQYLVGLVGLFFLVGFSLASPQDLSEIVKPDPFCALFLLVIASCICNCFLFKVQSGLYLSLSMTLYLASIFILPAVPAALVSVIASAVTEFFVLKRGPAFAAQTCGMYAIAITIGYQVYESLGVQTFKGDFSLDMLVPTLGCYLVVRAINEAIICANLVLLGNTLRDSMAHLYRVSVIYLVLLPVAVLLAMLKTGNGLIVFGFSCTTVVIVSIIINQAFGSKEKESQQLRLVRELNEQLARQNEQQRVLGERINQTLASFLPLVQYYSRTSYDQETAIAQIATTMEELSRTANQIAGSADNVASAADQAREAADSGQQAVNATIEAINEVRLKVQEIADKISELGGKSERIGEIVTVINGIAGEIRLLALNATIEASGAGQFGRRFAVVANEVNQLADRSREALKQIKEIIAEIQAATSSSQRATIEGLSRMERSVELASHSEKANQEIISVVEHTAQAAAAISLATQQQRNASEQVVSSIHHVASRISQNADRISSFSKASAELEFVANELQTARPELNGK
jgi:methyl-accepting chemotaxis protein